MIQILKDVFKSSGLYQAFTSTEGVFTFGMALMILVSLVLIYLAIFKEYEPLLLLPIAFGMLLANLPKTGLLDKAIGDQNGGLIYYLSWGVKKGVYPALIFLGIGAMTDFGPLIARPSSMLLGAGAQFGIAFVFVVAITLGFDGAAAASTSIIAGADGPTAIYLTTRLMPGNDGFLSAITIAAYSYMALIPIIQPPIMRLLTTKKERLVRMETPKKVSKVQKLLFPIIITILCILLLPSVAPLIGMLMFGNLMRESGVVQRLSDTAQNSLINIVTIFLGLSVGASAGAGEFLKAETLKIIVLGLTGFVFSTVGGILIGKVMCFFTKGKVNPLIGAAGVSAVPMSARVAQVEGLKEDPQNHLLMHAMAANVSGVIGSAIAAGILLVMFA